MSRKMKAGEVVDPGRLRSDDLLRIQNSKGVLHGGVVAGEPDADGRFAFRHLRDLWFHPRKWTVREHIPHDEATEPQPSAPEPSVSEPIAAPTLREAAERLCKAVRCVPDEPSKSLMDLMLDWKFYGTAGQQRIARQVMSSINALEAALPDPQMGQAREEAKPGSFAAALRAHQANGGCYSTGQRPVRGDRVKCLCDEASELVFGDAYTVSDFVDTLVYLAEEQGGVPYLPHRFALLERFAPAPVTSREQAETKHTAVEFLADLTDMMLPDPGVLKASREAMERCGHVAQVEPSSLPPPSTPPAEPDAVRVALGGMVEAVTTQESPADWLTVQQVIDKAEANPLATLHKWALVTKPILDAALSAAQAALAQPSEGERLRGELADANDRLRCLMGELRNSEPQEAEEFARRIAEGDDALEVIKEAMGEWKAHFNYRCELHEQDLRKLNAHDDRMEELQAQLAKAEEAAAEAERLRKELTKANAEWSDMMRLATKRQARISVLETEVGNAKAEMVWFRNEWHKAEAQLSARPAQQDVELYPLNSVGSVQFTDKFGDQCLLYRGVEALSFMNESSPNCVVALSAENLHRLRPDFDHYADHGTFAPRPSPETLDSVRAERDRLAERVKELEAKEVNCG